MIRSCDQIGIDCCWSKGYFEKVSKHDWSEINRWDQRNNGYDREMYCQLEFWMRSRLRNLANNSWKCFIVSIRRFCCVGMKNRRKKNVILKNKVFDKMIQWFAGEIVDKEAREHVIRYTDIMIADRFGWTYDEIINLPQEFYDDCVLIMNKQATYQNEQHKKQQRQSKYRR